MKRLLAVVGATALMCVGLATPATANGDGGVTYDLIAYGGDVSTSVDIGDVTITNNDDGTATVKIDVNGSLDPAATATDTLLYGVHIQTGCLDEDNTIYVNRDYTGTFYSPYNLPADIQIAEPGNINAVTWLLNNAPDTVMIEGAPQAVTAGDIQVAIWLLMGEATQNPGLPGGYSLARAQALETLALGYTDYVPQCGDQIPLVLYVPNVQTTMVQTTFIALEVPCETLTSTAMAMNTAVEVAENGTMRYGEQFPGNNWFSYVFVPPAPTVE